MTEKTQKSLPKRPPRWPDPVPIDPENISPIAADPAPWWWPWYDPAPPWWWDQLEVADKAKVAAAQLAYKRSELKAKLAYIDKLMEVLK
jgi:hypothetical protein